MPKPEERLLSVVHALLHRCYKLPFSDAADVPESLRNELAGRHSHKPQMFPAFQTPQTCTAHPFPCPPDLHVCALCCRTRFMPCHAAFSAPILAAALSLLQIGCSS